MKSEQPLTGLVAAVHTPFHEDGSLHPGAIEKQAAHLEENGIHFAFISGTTGECASLTLEERRTITGQWMEVTRGSSLRVIVHVGSNCLADSTNLARHAQEVGALAIAAFSPSYFKPATLDLLIDCCAEIARGAPGLPFYYYDIPSLTGVSFPMREFLEKGASRIPTLAGLKFTNPNLMAYLQCLALGGEWDIPWGIDEWLLGALATGARGAVGSSYNFAAPIYHDVIGAFEHGDLPAARAAQHRSTELIALLSRSGYMGAAKAVMNLLGVNVGPARLPHIRLTPEQVTLLRRDLENLGFFDWIRR